MTKTYTTSDLSRRSGDIIADAMKQPVTITQRNTPRLVLLNIEDYERLREYADHRRAFTMATLPEDLFAAMKKAIDDYAAEPDE